jgi:hypothetical protein
MQLTYSSLKGAWSQPLNLSSDILVSSLCFHIQLVYRYLTGVSCRCMSCGGVGYVRMNTLRVEPDFDKDDSMPAEYSPGKKKEEEFPPWLTIK